MTIKSHLSYLEKQRFAPRQIQAAPPAGLGLVVVIPCFAEPDLLRTLESLEACQAPKAAVEVIVVINSGKDAEEAALQQNRRTLQLAEAWRESGPKQFACYFLHFPELPRKHAGVGLARKIGMDEAVDRLDQAGNPEGVIACLDADSVVDPDYLQALERHFSQYPTSEACSLYFEHPLEGDEFPREVYEGIVRYELFLRYYVEALRFAEYPHAYHTIGSSMAVRSKAYQLVGGMNRRKAGEDFYFLHKLIPRGRFSELNATRVIPSPRPGDRVPFGTGKAILNWLDEAGEIWPAYALASFADLKKALSQVALWFEQDPEDLPDAVHAFFLKENFAEKLAEIRRHTTHQDTFTRRFFSWFDGLKVLQFVHFARDHFYPDVSVEQAASELLKHTGSNSNLLTDPRQLLVYFRKLERSREEGMDNSGFEIPRFARDDNSSC